MSLGEKLKLLRKEKRWSQDELAFNAGIDGRQLSRYENDRVTPSAEIIVKLADAYEVSIDYLLREDVPRAAVERHDLQLVALLRQVEALPEEDRLVVQKLIDAFITKHKLKELAA